MSGRTVSESVTDLLAEYVAGTRWEDLPEPARRTASRMVLDTTGVAIAGAVDLPFQTLRSYVAETAGRGEVPAPLPRRVDPSWAAFSMGAAAHLLDYDDFHSTIGGHPSAPVLPVVFSLGYMLRASGTDVLCAFAIGAEVEARIGAGINPGHYSIGWHPTAVIGAIGAAAAASTLLHLDAGAVRRAFGIAAALASGTKASFGTLTKSVQIGIAARSGVEAALMARAGVTANDHILDEQYGGFCELFATAPDRPRMADRLGDKYLIVDPGVAVKLLPCCGSAQSSTWAVIDLWREHHFDPSRVRAIRTAVDRQRIPHTNRPVVRAGLEGKFSTQYCQAVAALTGGLGLGDFDDELVRAPERQAMMKVVELCAAADAGQWPDADEPTGSQAARVEIELDDGSVLRIFTPCPRGYPAQPASDEDLITKFVDCASKGIGLEAARTLARQLLQLESARDVAPLVEQAWSEAARRP